MNKTQYVQIERELLEQITKVLSEVGGFAHDALTLSGAARALSKAGDKYQVEKLLDMLWLDALGAVEEQACDLASIVYSETIKQ